MIQIRLLAFFAGSVAFSSADFIASLLWGFENFGDPLFSSLVLANRAIGPVLALLLLGARRRTWRSTLIASEATVALSAGAQAAFGFGDPASFSTLNLLGACAGSVSLVQLRRVALSSAEFATGVVRVEQIALGAFATGLLVGTGLKDCFGIRSVFVLNSLSSVVLVCWLLGGRVAGPQQSGDCPRAVATVPVRGLFRQSCVLVAIAAGVIAVGNGMFAPYCVGVARYSDLQIGLTQVAGVAGIVLLSGMGASLARIGYCGARRVFLIWLGASSLSLVMFYSTENLFLACLSVAFLQAATSVRNAAQTMFVRHLVDIVEAEGALLVQQVVAGVVTVAVSIALAPLFGAAYLDSVRMVLATIGLAAVITGMVITGDRHE